MKKLILFILIITIMVACTKNSRTRSFGGTQEIKLPPGQRLINATWKETSLWYLTEPMPVDYIPSNKDFTEDSSYGVWEGKVVFIESR